MQNKGFTLVEMILYSAIVSMVAVSLTTFFIMMSENRYKSIAMSDINYVASFVLRIMTDDIKNSDSIITPTAGNSGNILTIRNNGTDTEYSLIDGNIVKLVGSASSTYTRARIIFSELEFIHESSGMGTNIGITLKAEIIDSTVDNKYSKVFYTSATKRK